MQKLLSLARRFPKGLVLYGFSGLGIALQRIYVWFSGDHSLQVSLIRLESIRQIRISFKGQTNSDYSIFVINRDKDVTRLVRFQKAGRRHGIRFERLPAVDLSDPQAQLHEFDPDIGDTFFGTDNFLRPAVGCFLSHVKAWRVIRDGEFEAAIICEDDARLLGPFPSSWKQFSPPENCDVVFLNQRMSDGLQESVNLRRFGGGEITLASSFDAIQALERRNQRISGPGTDGYLVTRKGAARLLQILEKNRITMEVDWFLFFYSMTPAQRVAFLDREGSKRFDKLTFSDDYVHVYVSFPYWIEQSGQQSTIDAFNTHNYMDRTRLLSRKT